jgi:hypothetical protein
LPDDHLIAVADWVELARVLHREPVDLMVIDPSSVTAKRSAPRRARAAAEEEGAPSALLTLQSEFRSVPMVLYSAHTPAGIRAVLPLVQRGVYAAVFRGFDDTTPRLRELVDRIGADILASRLLVVVIPRLEARGAPSALVDAVVRLFRSPTAFPRMTDFLAAAQRERGSLDRWMHVSGIAPARVLVLAARAAWVYQYARAPGSRLKSLALRLGYPDLVRFGRHIRWVTRHTPSELRTRVSPDELLQIITHRILRDAL